MSRAPYAAAAARVVFPAIKTHTQLILELGTLVAASLRRRAKASCRERQRCTTRNGRCTWCSRRLQRPRSAPRTSQLLPSPRCGCQSGSVAVLQGMPFKGGSSRELVLPAGQQAAVPHAWSGQRHFAAAPCNTASAHRRVQGPGMGGPLVSCAVVARMLSQVSRQCMRGTWPSRLTNHVWNGRGPCCW